MLKIDKLSGRDVLMESDIPFLKVFKKGKVREVYELGDQLLIVATDRLSAFDVVMKSGIPHKGVYLTKQSSFWFKLLNQKGYLTHFVTDDIAEIAKLTGEKRLLDLPWLKGRTMLGKRAELVPVEAVCRFRVFGSAIPALKEKKWIWEPAEIEGEIKEGALIKNGPLFTPTEKSETDDKISFEQMVKIVGDRTRAEEIKNKTLEIFRLANDHAQKAFGFEIADGKIEWGLYDGKLMLIDETFTSDSARFIPDKSKEFFRSWLKEKNLKGQAVTLPNDIALAVADLYASQCRSMRVL
jgi:phosphoribosylaminoimidazole-succinocarboxamide synthase